PLGAQVPRLLLLGGPGKAGQAQGCAEDHREDEGEGAGADAARRSVSREDRRRAELVSARMEGVLPPRGHAEDLRGTRRVDPTSPAGDPPQALETRSDGLLGAEETRRVGKRR